MSRAAGQIGKTVTCTAQEHHPFSMHFSVRMKLFCLYNFERSDIKFDAIEHSVP